MIKYSKTKFNEEARKLLIQGAKEVYNAVGTTLGARGRNIIIHKNHHTRVLHDGHKIAEEINPRNKFKRAGAEIIKQAEQQQVTSTGDGTTVAVVLGYAIASEALKVVESGVNPMGLRSGLEKGKELLIKRIRELSIPIKTEKQKIDIATISSEDEDMGRMIGETYEKAGAEAVITAEDSIGNDTFIDHQEGLQVDSGWKHELFVTNPNNMTATINDPKILVTDYKLNDPFIFQDLFTDLSTQKLRSLVVFAEDIEGNMLATLLNNKIQGRMNFLAIKAPSYQREKFLQDLAIMTGAKYISSTAKFGLEEVRVEHLGSAKKVTATKDATVVVGGAGNKKEIRERIDSIKNQIKEEDNDFQREKLKERLAKLTGGVFVIKVGGHTEVEAEERKERADDAILATRAAIQDGIVAGGEVVFLEALKVLKPQDEDEDYAYRILKSALRKPFEKLLANAGMNSGEMIAKLNGKKFGYGIDVTDGKIKDMVKEGIIDPAKVAIEAIKNATSVANSLITSDGIIAEHEDTNK